ncbi:MAG TPA: hypothetical protein VGI27_11085 [Solirubrobacteraceae bacterium]
MRRPGLKPPNELVAAVVARDGLSRRTWRVITFVHEWAICEAEFGRHVTSTEFAHWTVSSRKTAFNRLTDFRALFPEFSTPADMIRWPHERPATADLDELDWTAIA